ncbi:MAG: DUF4912 domain-containing protein [Saprospiraceae bacterium]|nr:DUF4912 domain-containing protein [Pyrinomonadaceae bacterium]
MSDTQGEGTIEFVLDEFAGISSESMVRGADRSFDLDQPNKAAAAELENETVSPVFRELADPKLPELSRENRARLLMQSPTQLFFYWSVKNNPFQTLDRALGGKTSSYMLVAKLINLKNSREDIHPVEAEGSFWFNVDANSEYQAEIGLYAPNRPYIRIMFSNKVETPRKAPSPRPASSSEWTVSADKFAQVLDVAGFTQDAFDVAIAGDDLNASGRATEAAFSRFIGPTERGIKGIEHEEMRFAMLALASGVPLEYLRWRISPSLFTILQENSSKLSGENALAALQEQFSFEAGDIIEEEMFSPAVFGASLINFPRSLKRRQDRSLAKFTSISSPGFRA